MKRLTLMALAMCATAALAACHTTRQPQLRHAQITPAQLRLEQSAVITVEVVDPYKLVARVEGMVAGYPQRTFALKDDGVPPDAKAGDGIWSFQVEADFRAVPGEYTFEITAYNAAGDVVRVHNKEQGDVPLTATCTVAIQYPEP